VKPGLGLHQRSRMMKRKGGGLEDVKPGLDPPEGRAQARGPWCRTCTGLMVFLLGLDSA